MEANKIISTDSNGISNIGVCIKEMSDRKIGEIQFFNSPYFMSLEYWKPKHLHVVSDDVIKDGDWYVEINKKTGRRAVYKNVGSDILKDDSNYIHADLFKIIKSTDKDVNLPMSSETICESCNYE